MDKNSSSNRKAKSTAKPAKQAATTDASDKLSAIRDLLFGEQVSQINTDVAASFKQLQQQIAALEKNLDKQLAAVHASIEKQINTVNQQLERIDCEHQSAESILEQNIESLEKRHQALIEDVDNQVAETQKALTQQGNQLEKQIQAEVEKLTQLIDQRASELGNNKADRKTLAALLETVASNLTENPA